MTDRLYGIVGGGCKTKQEKLLVGESELGVVLTIIQKNNYLEEGESSLGIIVDKEELLKLLRKRDEVEK